MKGTSAFCGEVPGIDIWVICKITQFDGITRANFNSIGIENRNNWLSYFDIYDIGSVSTTISIDNDQKGFVLTGFCISMSMWAFSCEGIYETVTVVIDPIIRRHIIDAGV